MATKEDLARWGRALRFALDDPSLDGVPDKALGLVVAQTLGDMDLAETAVRMRPRPSWVRTLIGAPADKRRQAA